MGPQERLFLAPSAPLERRAFLLHDGRAGEPAPLRQLGARWRYARPVGHPIGALLSIVLVFACAPPAAAPGSSGPPLADYGDAPANGDASYQKAVDAHFPTDFDADGARVLVTGEGWLGREGSAERNATDPSDPDGANNLVGGDSDDGVVDFRLSMDSSPPRATLAVSITLQGATEGSFWLNVLVDLNSDGQWRGRAAGGEPEWAVQNFLVPVKAGQAEQVQPPPFAFSNGPILPQKAWMRVALTNTRVPAGWEGTGEFQAGEIEDYLIALPKQGGPLLAIDCTNARSGTQSWSFEGALSQIVSCQIKNYRPQHSGKYEYALSARGGRGAPRPQCTPGPTTGSASTGLVRGGPVNLPLGSTPTKLKCLFTSQRRLPSFWALEATFGGTSFEPFPQGFYLGTEPTSGDQFELQAGHCRQSCSADSFCQVGNACRNGCCMPRWGQCSQFETETECAQCCATTGGNHAAECMRQDCLNR